MTLALGIAIGLVAALLLIIVFRRTSPAEAPAVAQLRNDVQSLRQSTENSIQNVATAFSTQLQTVTSNVQSSLTGVTAQLGDRLDAINRQVTEQLNQSTNLMTSSSHAVTSRYVSDGRLPPARGGICRTAVSSAATGHMRVSASLNVRGRPR